MTDIQVIGKNMNYKCIKFGTNINNTSFNTRKLKTFGDLYQWSKVMKMDNIKGGVIVFTTSYKDVETYVMDGSLHLVDSTHRTATNDYVDNKHTLSGVILLGMITLQKQHKGIISWNSGHNTLMGKHKATVITSDGKHHGSHGKYYSYGNKANFCQNDLSTIGQYASKPCAYKSHLKGLCIEELSQMEMQLSVKQLSIHLPILHKLLSPVVSIANEMQSDIGTINLKETTASDEGIWQTCMCINAQTIEFHTEMDCTYTLIHVPDQDVSENNSEYHFMFQLSTLTNVSIHMKPGLSFMFSGQFLTHRQSSNNIEADTKGNFINFASYGNARLYRHIRNSFERVRKYNTSKLN